MGTTSDGTEIREIIGCSVICIEMAMKDSKITLHITPEELLNKVGPVNWFREPSDSEESNRYRWAMSQMQSHFPGKYDLEEAYDPVSMCFKYRMKFLTEADEMWFKLKYQ